MRNIEVIVLSLDEVYEDIINWQADMIVNDRQNVIKYLRDGKLDCITCNIRKQSVEEVVEYFAELNLGEKYVVRHRVRTNKNPDQVVVEIDPEHYTVVWDVLNAEELHRLSSI